MRRPIEKVCVDHSGTHIHLVDSIRASFLFIPFFCIFIIIFFLFEEERTMRINQAKHLWLPRNAAKMLGEFIVRIVADAFA